MTRSVILYTLNDIDLKLEWLRRDNEDLPDCELTDNFKKRYQEYLEAISEKVRQLQQKYKVEN